jgi:hypothetical protein
MSAPSDLAANIAAHVVDELRRKGTPTSEEDLAQFIALLIATEFPDADEASVKAAIAAVNAEIRAGAFRPVESLRRIDPVNVAGLDIGEPLNGEPICERVDPRTLFVDPAYQRDIRERGLRQINQIVEGWDWNKFKPPICAYAEHDGQTVLKVLDGQHTAIAAASHPGITMIPVMIVEARETSSQAAAFVGQNTQRLNVTPLQLHQAALVAQDDDAVTIDQVCRKAGVRVLQYSVKQFEAGDTVAINAIAKLVDARGAMKARIILEVLAKARMAPILAPQIKAVELLLTDDEYRLSITPEALTEAITGSWLTDQDEGKRIALSHKWPFWRALAIHWFRNTKKTKPAAAGRAA